MTTWWLAIQIKQYDEVSLKFLVLKILSQTRHENLPGRQTLIVREDMYHN